VTTRSCLLSRNAHLDEATITRAFSHIGIRTVVWLDGGPSGADHDRTSGRLHGLPARSQPPRRSYRSGARTAARVRDLAALRQAVEDSLLRALRPFGRPRQSCFEFASAQFAGTYLNFFVTRRSVLTARFGDDQEDSRGGPAARVLPGPRDPHARYQCRPAWGRRDTLPDAADAVMRAIGACCSVR
jgi:agmatine deiminase